MKAEKLDDASNNYWTIYDGDGTPLMAFHAPLAGSKAVTDAASAITRYEEEMAKPEFAEAAEEYRFRTASTDEDVVRGMIFDQQAVAVVRQKAEARAALREAPVKGAVITEEAIEAEKPARAEVASLKAR